MTNIEKAQTVSEMVDGLDLIKELAEHISVSSSTIHRYIHEEVMYGDTSATLNLEFHAILNCVDHIRMTIDGRVMPDLEKLA